MSRRSFFNIGEEGRLLLNFINGQSVSLTSNSVFDVYEPRSGRVLTQTEKGSKDDVYIAVACATAAQKKWGALPWLARGSVLSKAAELIKVHCEELALWESKDNGKPIKEAEADVLSCAETLQYYSGINSGLVGQFFPMAGNRYAYTTREPIGVVGCVGAWNYPIQTCTWKAAPAIACGNAVVYKPSPLAPVTAVLLGHLLKEAGLPDGVFNVIQGDAETGRHLVEHPEVKKVSFTGSTATGKDIMQRCAMRNVKPVTLELGGKSSLIICEDACIDSAVAGAMAANFYSQGQVCSNASKVLIHASKLQEFTTKVVDLTRNMSVGDPLSRSTTVGAHISREHRDRIKNYIDTAQLQGAIKLCGGEHVEVPELENGYYLSPCVLSNINDSMDVYKEEIFGSVMLLIPFLSDEEAVIMANDTSMGLAAGVFTKDLSKGYNISKQLNAGTVYVNTYNDTSPFVPFGGIGDSGFGRENGTAAVDYYTTIKSVFVNTTELENPFM
ncbi:unnamed protein product [Auanema sp. JU1783]|nr:unnamed protein product [Auanema sp. JU1783]